MSLGARVVVAGTHSGAGKTTVATGLMAALRRRGGRIAAAKVGPDFIDPGYHALATGRPGRNLDPFLSGEACIPALADRAGTGADILVVEGVMGLFDGAGPSDLLPGASPSFASTAHVARLLDAPVLLVVDASAMSTSVAALVQGYATFDVGVPIAGVILNRVGSDAHEETLRDALAPLGIPLVGALRRDPAMTWRDRHLGLVPVVEDAPAVAASLDRLAAAVAAACDLDAIVRIAAAAPDRPATSLPSVAGGPHVRIALAAGRAFSFMYEDNLEALTAAGAELVAFDPLHAPALPEGVSGLVAGGGFPEVYARELAANAPLLADVRTKVGAGLVTWAECGGLLWLARSLDATPMAGVLPGDAAMTERLTLGYRRATTGSQSPIGPAGTTVRGHEFHYSTLDPPGDALEVATRRGVTRAGYAGPSLIASYVHVHAAATPDIVTSFVAAASSSRPCTGVG